MMEKKIDMRGKWDRKKQKPFKATKNLLVYKNKNIPVLYRNTVTHKRAAQVIQKVFGVEKYDTYNTVLNQISISLNYLIEDQYQEIYLILLDSDKNETCWIYYGKDKMKWN